MKRIVLLVLVFFFLVGTSFSGRQEPLPKDIQGSPIQAVSSINYISNISITSSSYVAISVPVNVTCKSIYVKTRDGNSWRLATSSSPSSYALIDFNFSIALVKTAPGIMFYEKAESTSDTLEIIFMD
jgi:hypothetical protein